MTLPKKGSRSISIDGCEFRYKVSGNDGWIDVLIELEAGRGQKLKAVFDYHTELSEGGMRHQERKVTPSIIRQLIQHALSIGWQPEVGGEADLLVDGEVVAPL